MKVSSTLWGWNDRLKNESFLPQGRHLRRPAPQFFLFFLFLLTFGTVAASAATFTVTTSADDEMDGCRIRACTFREALYAAAAAPPDRGKRMVTFQPGVAGKIYLTGGPLLIPAGLDIEGPARDTLEIRGNSQNRIFLAATDGAITPAASLTVAPAAARPAGQLFIKPAGSRAAAVPEEASINLGGKVRERNGRPISRAYVSLTDPQGAVRVAVSNQFGYFVIEDLAAGATYILSARHRRHAFEPQIVNSRSDRKDINVIAGANQRLTVKETAKK